MKNIRYCISGVQLFRGLALLLVVTMLCGCGSPEPTPAGTTAAIEATASPGPQMGASIKLPMPEGAELGNPLAASTREMSSIYGLIFESLVEIDDSAMPGPGLAETWTDSDDGLTWTFTLRSGVKWHGTGRQINAQDVIFTLNLIKQMEDNTPYSYITDYISIDECEAGDDGTVILKLVKPFFGFFHALTFPILPSDGGYAADAAPERPVGTGAYTVTSYVKGQSIKLSANADWWKTEPSISDIEILPFPDNAAEISSLLLTEIDALQTEDLTVTQYRDSGYAELYEYPTRYFEFMALNFTSLDLKDNKMRQAVAYAIDRVEVVSYTYVNHASVSDTCVPPESWLYDGKLLHYNNDEAEARRLIKLVGWLDSDDDGYWDTSPDGVKRDLKFTLLTNLEENNTLRNDAAVLMAGQLDKVGIKAEVKAVAWDEYNQMLSEKRFDMALCGCYLSPVPDYTTLLATNGALNVGGYTSQEMDSLLASILESKDSSILKVKIGELQTMIMDDLPIICLYFRTHTLLISPDLKNVSGAHEDNAFAKISQWYKEIVE